MIEASAGVDVRREIQFFAQDTRRQCQGALRHLHLAAPTESLDSFLERDLRSGWATHDTDVDLIWNDFVHHIEGVESLLDTRYLSKPSGPLRAPLTCVWAYPTYSTKKQMFGHTMDKTNPCLAGQYAKIGPHPAVRTQDRLPIRESHDKEGVPWARLYPRWQDMEQSCLLLNQRLNKHSKFLILLGQDNYRSFDKLFDNSRIKTVSIPLKGFKLYQEPYCVKLRRDIDSGRIVQVVWFSHHIQRFFYLYHMSPMRCFHDLLWNGISELAGILVQDPFCFSTRASSAGQSASSVSRRHGLLETAIQMRILEKETGKPYPEDYIRQVFRVWISNDPAIAARRALDTDASGSYLTPLLAQKQSQGGQTAGPTNVRKMIASNLGRYHSEDWHVSSERATRADQGKLAAGRLQRENAEKRQLGQLPRPVRSTQALVHFEDSKRVYQAERTERLAQGLPNASDERLDAGSRKGLERSVYVRKQRSVYKAKALFKVLQVKFLLNKDPESLHRKKDRIDLRRRSKLLVLRDLLDSPQPEIPDMLVRWMRKNVRFYDALKHPDGLRFEGDGSNSPDTFPYSNTMHPAVFNA